MLPSLTERLRLYLHPNQLALVREAGLRRRRVTAMHAVTGVAAGQQPWSGAIIALQELLSQPQWRGAPATVNIADSLLRFRVDESDGRLNAEERDVLLRHRFTETFGDSLREWKILSSPGRYGRAGLACAVDPRLLDAVQQTFLSDGVKLSAVRPLLMAGFNQWRREIDGRAAWLVLVESSCLTTALVLDGAWHAVATHPIQPDWEETLAIILQRQALPLGLEAASIPVYLFWPERQGHKPQSPGLRQIHLLNLPVRAGYVPQRDWRMAMALCG